MFFRCYYRGTIEDLSRIFYVGFPENGYLDDTCCIKLSRNLNFLFANIMAELSRTPRYTCNVRVYVNPLQGPLDRCSHVCIYICTTMIPLVIRSLSLVYKIMQVYVIRTSAWKSLVGSLVRHVFTFPGPPPLSKQAHWSPQQPNLNDADQCLMFICGSVPPSPRTLPTQFQTLNAAVFLVIACASVLIQTSTLFMPSWCLTVGCSVLASTCAFSAKSSQRDLPATTPILHPVLRE